MLKTEKITPSVKFDRFCQSVRPKKQTIKPLGERDFTPLNQKVCFFPHLD